MSGFALIHRTLLDHPAFRDGSEAMAFGWMIVRASWRDTVVRYKGHRIELRRGQLAISVRDMAAQMNRDKGWIERLWKRLKQETMIETDNKTGVAVITICNYDEYQQIPNQEKTAAGTRQPVDKRQAQDSGKTQNNTGNIPLSNDNGGDLSKSLFDQGVRLLADKGRSETQARSILAKFQRDFGDGPTLAALNRCRNATDPVSAMRAELGKTKSQSEYYGV